MALMARGMHAGSRGHGFVRGRRRIRPAFLSFLPGHSWKGTGSVSPCDSGEAAAVKDRQGFHPVEVMPGVVHVEGPMGVCMTLLLGRDRALLVDAG